MHPDAELAAQAGREAYAQGGSAAFWAMHDQLLAQQDKLKRDNLDDLARANKIDLARWRTALDVGTHSKEIEAAKQAGTNAGIIGTPMFLIAPRAATRGYLVSGAETYSTFRRLIERALNEAK
jgi:protein-disulfide isomerase